MKILKIVTGVLSAMSALIMIAMPILSSKMQGFYKTQTPASAQLTKELLDKKQLWVQIGESKVFFYIFITCVSAFVIVWLIDWLKARKAK